MQEQFLLLASLELQRFVKIINEISKILCIQSELFLGYFIRGFRYLNIQF